MKQSDAMREINAAIEEMNRHIETYWFPPADAEDDRRKLVDRLVEMSKEQECHSPKASAN